MKLLITGFEPFDGDETNPSWAIAQECVKYHLAHGNPEIEMFCREIPVEWQTTWTEISKAVEEIQPDCLICLGLSSECKGIQIETVARNEAKCYTDNCGEYFDKNQGKSGRTVVLEPEKSETYSTTLPVEWLIDAYNSHNPKPINPIITSDNAGGYLCNLAFYKTMAHLPEVKYRGFIHVGKLKTIEKSAAIAIQLIANWVLDASK